MTDVAPEKALVDASVLRVRSAFADWEPAASRANKQLWAMLGCIYEEADRIEKEEGGLNTLRSLVQASPEARHSNRWVPDGKGAGELLLVLLHGLKPEVKVTRCHHLGALKAAQAKGIAPTADAFVSWMQKVGGIISARKAAANKAAEPRQKFADLAQPLLVNTGELPTVRLSIDAAGELFEEFSLLLVHRGVGQDRRWNEDLAVVSKIAEPKLVEAAIVAAKNRIAHPQDEKRQIEQAARIEEAELRFLIAVNTVTILHASNRLTNNSLVRWMRAWKLLNPSLQQKFLFGPDRGWSITMGDTLTGKKPEIQAIKPDLPLLDPGRFVKSALPGALLPYVTGENQKASVTEGERWLFHAKKRVQRIRFERKLRKDGFVPAEPDPQTGAPTWVDGRGGVFTEEGSVLDRPASPAQPHTGLTDRQLTGLLSEVEVEPISDLEEVG